MIYLLILLNMIGTDPLPEVSEKPTLYYLYDPLCGWCYGFSPVILSIHEKWKDKLDFEVISGGMILNERTGPLHEVAPYIKTAYIRVEDLTGVKFGEPFLTALLADSTIMLNSWPGALAMTIFKSHYPDKAVYYASDLQNAIYRDGISTEDTDHFATLAVKYGMDKNSFLEGVEDPKYHYETKQDFQTAQNLQATGFPTVILKYGDNYFLLARGYTSEIELNKRITDALKK